MIGFSPRLYPDELFYSIVARYHEYSLNHSPKYTSQELFGHAFQLAVPDLPINLSLVSKQLDTFMTVGVNALIQDHTFFYFYTNFITADKIGTVRDAMISRNHKGAVHMITGVMASGIKEKQFFYHCPECINDDFNDYEETYWKLQHQLPGVFVCLKHNSILFESSIPFRSKKRNVFVSAVNAVCIKPCVKVNNKKTWDILCVIAGQCSHLASKDYGFDLNKLQKAYKILLRKKGLLSSKGVVYQKKLSEQFKSFYSEEILKIFQSNVSYEDSSCWLKAITRKHRKTFHPIRHLLFILFLGESIETINRLGDNNDNPFGKGPYLCLNKAAEHFGARVITQVEVTSCSRTKELIGTFKCECGFYYTKRESDQGSENDYEISRVKQFGELWIKTVKELIHSKQMSYRAVARQLGVDTNTIIKYVNAKPSMVKVENTKVEEIIASKKQEWINLIKDNKELSVTQLRINNSALYSFLYRNERGWLKENSPKKKRENKLSRIDWNIRDCFIRDEIVKATKNILNKEPLQRLTISSIGTEIGKRYILQQHLDKLTKTKDLLYNVIEDINTFQIRRVKWNIAKLRDYGDLSRSKIVRNSGLKEPISPDVDRLIKSVLNEV